MDKTEGMDNKPLNTRTSEDTQVMEVNHLEAGWLTVKKACERLNLQKSRVLQLIRQKRLHSKMQNVGEAQFYLVCEGCVEDYAKNRRKPGRPQQKGLAEH